MIYPRAFIRTRRSALIYALVVTSLSLAFVGLRVDELSWSNLFHLTCMSLLPLFGTYAYCRFLKKMEQIHQTPTPEMAFIMDAAFGLATVIGAFTLITIDRIDRL